MTKDAIVIGGGVIGCAIALRLARNGLRVTLIERGQIGCEASRAAAGMLLPQTDAPSPDPFFHLCLRSHSMYRDFAAEIKELSGIDPEYRDEGTLSIVTEREDERAATLWADWQIEAGFAVEKLTAGEVRRFEPAVTESASGAVFIPGDHQIENRLLMDGLALAIRRASVEVIEGSEVSAILIDEGKATGVVSNNEILRAGVVIAAAGSWSSALLNPLGLKINITPARGQMVALKLSKPLINHVLHSSRCYLVPRRDGRILVGATVEYAGFEKKNTAGAVHSLLDAALDLMPGLAGCEIVEAWSGLRPDTPDHLPVLGRSPIDNLLLATGHFRNGILLAPITAELIAQTVINNRAPDELEHFGILRFD